MPSPLITALDIAIGLFSLLILWFLTGPLWLILPFLLFALFYFGLLRPRWVKRNSEPSEKDGVAEK